MNLTGFADIHGQPLNQDSATPLCALGTVVPDSRGRFYKYVGAGAAALVPGQLVQAAVEAATNQELTPTVAQGVGSKQIVATLGAAAAAENLFAEGLAVITTDPGGGLAYGISGHAAVLSGGVITVNLRGDDPIQVALTTVSRVSLIPHPCKNVVQSAGTAAPVGVGVYPIGIGRYGWVGVQGDFPVLIVGTPAVGNALSPGAGGAAAINSGTLPIIGSALVTGVAGKYQLARIALL